MEELKKVKGLELSLAKKIDAARVQGMKRVEDTRARRKAIMTAHTEKAQEESDMALAKAESKAEKESKETMAQAEKSMRKLKKAYSTKKEDAIAAVLKNLGV